MKASFVIVSLIVLVEGLLGCSSKSNKAGAAGSGGSSGHAQGSAGSGGAGHASASGAGGAGTSGGAGAAAGAMSTPTGIAGWQAYMDPLPATKGTVERGQYLVDHVLVCGVCHTPSLPSGEPDPTKY